jgi:hypothetical protein
MEVKVLGTFRRIMSRLLPQALFVCCVLASLAGVGRSATLEKLSLEEMSQKSTLIVRGRVTGCAGEMQGSVIYTACRVAVSERWKGNAGSEVRFVIPGGRAHGLVQTFTGTPKMSSGSEYVLFLWAGRSGINQVIGMSQGVFSLQNGGKQPGIVTRSATTERMVDKAGNEIEDDPVSLRVADLRERVRRALAAESQ